MIPRLHDIDFSKVVYPTRRFLSAADHLQKIKAYFHDRTDAWVRFSVHQNLHILCENPQPNDDQFDDPHFTHELLFNNKGYKWADAVWINCADPSKTKFFVPQHTIQIGYEVDASEREDCYYKIQFFTDPEDLFYRMDSERSFHFQFKSVICFGDVHDHSSNSRISGDTPMHFADHGQWYNPMTRDFVHDWKHPHEWLHIEGAFSNVERNYMLVRAQNKVKINTEKPLVHAWEDWLKCIPTQFNPANYVELCMQQQTMPRIGEILW